MTADSAYDEAPTYRVEEKLSKDTTVVIPPPVTTVLIDTAEQDPFQQGWSYRLTFSKRMVGPEEDPLWIRSLVETAIRRYKTIIGPRMRARCLDGQYTEAAISVIVLDRMLEVVSPKSVRSIGKST